MEIFSINSKNRYQIDQSQGNILEIYLQNNVSILVKVQASTSDKLLSLYLGNRSFLIKLQTRSFSKVAGFYL